jgi:hypothetical protein
MDTPEHKKMTSNKVETVEVHSSGLKLKISIAAIIE